MDFAKVVGATFAVAILTASAVAQELELAPPQDWSGLSRAATIAAVSDALADINRPFAARAEFTSAYPVGFWDMERTVNDAITQMVSLRDTLAGNPYVRVSSFTVGFPWGVSVEFSFPPMEPDL